MLRDLIKAGVASTLYWSRADRLIGSRYVNGTGLRIIAYHRVVESLPVEGERLNYSMAVTRSTLARHLDWLASRFRFISLDDLEKEMGAAGELREPAAAITFDDGYSDVYHNAFPLLKQRGIPAAVFVVTDLVGTTHPQTHDRLYESLDRLYTKHRAPSRRLLDLLVSSGIRYRFSQPPHTPLQALRSLLDGLPQAETYRLLEVLESEDGRGEEVARRPLPLTWEMLAEMQASGITVGSHTRSHPILTNEEPARVFEETAGSRHELEKCLGRPVRHFAYPAGRFNRSAVRAVADSGYRFGYTTCRHRDPNYPLLTIPRTVFWENTCRSAFGEFSPALMSCQVHSVFDLFRPCREDHSAV